jgi:hypothetical protein
MKTFIRITEIWVPSEDRLELQYLDGLYGSCNEFRNLSQQMRFRYNLLPRRRSDQRHPLGGAGARPGAGSDRRGRNPPC